MESQMRGMVSFPDNLRVLVTVVEIAVGRKKLAQAELSFPVERRLYHKN